MNQTYTHEFQCQYELQRYPFDLQARKILTKCRVCSLDLVNLLMFGVVMFCFH